MAILVYTSVNVDPINNRAEGEIDLSNGGTLPANVNIYAQAVDSEDPGATFAYQWYLLSSPEGSAAAIANPATNNTQITDIDTWSNYRLFCVAQNTSSGAFSESDILKAHNAAFLNINVVSQNAQIEKPAKGERNWYDKANTWAQRIEDLYVNLGGFAGLPVRSNGASFTIPVDGSVTYVVEGTDKEIEVTGINNSTENPAEYINKIGLPDTVEISSSLTISEAGAGSLTVNGSADITGSLDVSSVAVDDTLTVTNETTLSGDIFVGGPIASTTAPYSAISSNGSTWFLNKDADTNGTLDGVCEILTTCDLPEPASRGGVLTADPVSWSSSADLELNPDAKLPDHSIINFSQSVEGSVYVLSGSANPVLSEFIEAYNPGDQGVWPHVLHRNLTGKTLHPKAITAMFHDLGNFTAGSNQEYIITFVVSKDVFTNSWSTTEGTATWSTIYTNHMAGHELIFKEPVDIEPGDYFGILVTQGTDLSKPAHRMTSDITCYLPLV